MTIEFRLPNLGENVDSGDVLSVLVSEGDQVQAEQGLLELETDKATIEVPSPSAGKIAKIHVSEGDTVPVGGLLLTIEDANGQAAVTRAPASEPVVAAAPVEAADVAAKPVAIPPTDTAAAPAEAPPGSEPPPANRGHELKTPVPPSSVVEVPGDGHASAAASPSVRRLARELGVDLRHVRPTGSGGRITQEDVQAHVREANQQESAQIAANAKTPPGMPSSDGKGAVRREKMSRMRQTIARNMLQSYSTIPQLTNFDDADVTELEKIRQSSKADYAKNNIKLTTMPFLIKAVASALKHHPIINASLDEENNEIIYKEYVNIGIAVDTERGLVVPVLRDVDRMNIPRITHALADLAEQARAGSFGIEDLRGGTFTISNLGAIGGTYSTPIINPPEVAILLAGRSRTLPVYIDEQLAPRLMLPLSITYDHRIVDGAAAARFLNEVKDYLSGPGRLLMAP